MGIILCATKDQKIWHITKNKVETLCGEKMFDMLAEVESLEGRNLVCSQCLTGLPDKVEP